jgi:hypothetical protein
MLHLYNTSSFDLYHYTLYSVLLIQNPKLMRKCEEPTKENVEYKVAVFYLITLCVNILTIK